jgi:predicted RNA binding protein YcfA (HicA-like mRNA interferase family)
LFARRAIIDRMKVRDVLKILKEDGWKLVITRGSHRQL